MQQSGVPNVGVDDHVDKGVMASLYRHVIEGQMSCLEEMEEHRDILNEDIFLYGTTTCSCVERFEEHPLTPNQLSEDYRFLNSIQSGVCPHYSPQDSSNIRLGSKRLVHAAVTVGHMRVLQYLADHGCDLDAQTEGSHYTPILLAVKKNHQEIIKFLISRNVDVNVTSGVMRKTALIEAVTSFEATGELVDLILTSKRVDVNVKNFQRDTALSLAVQKNEFELVDALLKAGANCNIVDCRGNTPLMHASIHGNRAITRALIDSGAFVDVQNERQETALLFATYRDDLDLVIQLLEAGATPDLCTDEGYSALIIAAYDGSSDIIHHLFEHGADVSKQNNQGYTALHIAAWNGHVDSLNRLLLAGAPPDLQTQDKNTPLSLAAHGNHPAIIDVLLPLGCDLNNADKDLDTSLHYAAYNGMSETVEKLILCGADPNARNRINATPLWNAVYKNRQDVVKQLLLANVDMEVASVGIDQHAQSDLVHYLYDQPMSPLLVSVKRNLPHLALLLVAAGYDIFKEQWLVRQEFPDSLTSNNEFLSLLSHSVLNPPSLLKVCRTFIRRHLGRNVTKTVRTLEIPTTLKNYLTLNDLKN